MNKTPELVDLGLPSGNLWMKMNLGAISETDPGNYYQWGSLVGYQGEKAEEHSTWKTCPFNDKKDDFDKEYFKVNRHKLVYKNGILKPEYDVVTQAYGPGYKIPEPKDFQELLDNTTKKGRLFTSKTNGKSIFIPNSGNIWAGCFIGIGSKSYLWSSRLNPSHPICAYYFNCDYDTAIHVGSSFIHPCGLPIRGIKVKNE